MTLVDGRLGREEPAAQQAGLGTVHVVPVELGAAAGVLGLGVAVVLVLEAQTALILAVLVVGALAAGAEASLCGAHAGAENRGLEEAELTRERRVVLLVDDRHGMHVCRGEGAELAPVAGILLAAQGLEIVREVMRR